MNALEKAIIAAGDELMYEYNWSLGDIYKNDGTFDTLKTVFGKVLLKHLEPIFNPVKAKQARIAALRAELAELEK